MGSHPGTAKTSFSPHSNTVPAVWRCAAPLKPGRSREIRQEMVGMTGPPVCGLLYSSTTPS